MSRGADAEDVPVVGSDRGGPFATVPVGSGDATAGDDRARTVRVRNAAPERREIAVEVSRGATILVDRTVAFPAGGALELVLNEPADYRIRVGLADGDATAVAVAGSSFDRRAPDRDVSVLSDGRVEAAPVGTATEDSDSASATPDRRVPDADVGGADREHRTVEP